MMLCLLCGSLILATAVPGIGFAKASKYEERSVLGIRVVDIAPGLEDVVGLPTHFGAYVIEGNGPPKPDSGGIPIDTIRSEDLITGIGEEEVRSTQDLSRLVSAKQAGEWVKVKVLRKGSGEVLKIQVKSAPPVIYLPADTCPVLTGGEAWSLDMVSAFISGLPILGVSSVELSGKCLNVAEACSPLQLEKQTDTRTVIDINGWNHEIDGNWRAHTHLSRETCLQEKARLAARRRDEAR